MATNYGKAEGAVRREDVENKKKGEKNIAKKKTPKKGMKIDAIPMPSIPMPKPKKGKKIEAVPMPKPWEKKSNKDKLKQKIKSKKSK